MTIAVDMGRKATKTNKTIIMYHRQTADDIKRKILKNITEFMFFGILFIFILSDLRVYFYQG